MTPQGGRTGVLRAEDLRWATRLAGVAIGAAAAGSAIVVVAGSIEPYSFLPEFQLYPALVFLGPMALGVGALVVGLGEEDNPVVAGILTAQVACALAVIASAPAMPDELGGIEPMLQRLMISQFIPTVPVLGALGGFLGGRLRRLSGRC